MFRPQLPQTVWNLNFYLWNILIKNEVVSLKSATYLVCILHANLYFTKNAYNLRSASGFDFN